jgi:FAD/FMN-containing dehydrogenase
LNQSGESAVGSINRDQLRKLDRGFKGGIVTPEHRDYDTLRRVWNHDIDARPALIALCAGEDDVVRALEFARANDLTTAVRGGGHSFAGHGVCDGGIVINLSPMKRLRLDAPAKTAWIEPGIRASELDQTTQAFALAVPLGSCPMVGVTGFALGGGEGSLTARFGFGCDNVIEATLVAADGGRLRANENENAELFRALRGGGGNFGVVTSLALRLHPIDKVLSGHLKYPITRAKEILRLLDEYVQSIPDELYIIATVLPRPGDRMLDIGVVWSGDQRDGERVLRPLRALTRPSEDSLATKPYLEEQRSGSDSPSEGDWASHRRAGHLLRLDAGPIDAIAEHASSGPTETCGISMVYWHGEWCSRPRDDGFGFRRAGYEYWVHSYWQDPADREKSHRWVDDFFAALRPYSTGAVYVNDLENEGQGRVRDAYGDKYDWLAKIKMKYDPDNFFRVNQNIEPVNVNRG